jgi:hypothetical protein
MFWRVMRAIYIVQVHFKGLDRQAARVEDALALLVHASPHARMDLSVC